MPYRAFRTRPDSDLVVPKQLESKRSLMRDRSVAYPPELPCPLQRRPDACPALGSRPSRPERHDGAQDRSHDVRRQQGQVEVLQDITVVRAVTNSNLTKR